MKAPDIIGQIDAAIKEHESELSRLNAAREALTDTKPRNELSRGQRAARTRKYREGAKKGWAKRRAKEAAEAASKEREAVITPGDGVRQGRLTDQAHAARAALGDE